MLVLIVWIVFGILCYYVAEGKGRDPKMWGLLGFLGGIFTFIVLILVPSKNPNVFKNNYNATNYNTNSYNVDSHSSNNYNEQTIYCSKCGAKNDYNDTFCLHCGQMLKK